MFTIDPGKFRLKIKKNSGCNIIYTSNLPMLSRDLSGWKQKSLVPWTKHPVFWLINKNQSGVRRMNKLGVRRRNQSGARRKD